MKYLFFFFLATLSFCIFGDDTVKITGTKQVATYDRATKKLVPLKGIKPEEVYDALLAIITNTEKQVAECQAKAIKPEKKD